MVCLNGLIGLNSGAAIAAPADPWTELVLDVELRAGGAADPAVAATLVVLRDPAGLVYLTAADFEVLRLRLPSSPPHEQDGKAYYAPSAIPGSVVTLDEAEQRAVIAVPTPALETTRLSGADRVAPPITPASPGGFLNYQLSAQQIQGGTSAGVFGELGLFAGPGVLTNTVVARRGEGATELVRLDTTFTRDFPTQLSTLSVGDAISDPGSWGDALRFAGVRFSRNFAIRPDLLTTPLIATGGTATVPSTVDIFVNNQLVSSSQVPAGPFIVDRLPTVTGNGDVNVVVRDALGREVVVSQPFYTSNSLLAPGLSQYSVDLGRARENYAVASDQYGPALGEATYRRGITDLLTIEGHGEYLAGVAHAAGVNGVVGLGRLATLNLTAAGGGDAHAGSGLLTGIGIDHHGQGTSFAVSTSRAAAGFGQVGESPDPAMRVRDRSIAQIGESMGWFGSLSIAYVRQTYRDSPAQRTLGITQSARLGAAGSLNLSLSRTHTAAVIGTPAQDSTSAYLIFVHALGGRRAATVTGVSGSGAGAPPNELIGGLAESAPAGPGSGYRVSASTAGNYDADWRQQTAALDVDVEAARTDGIEGRSAYVTGAMTWLDGEVNVTRQISGSFAMVDLGGIAGVPVYVENQLIAHTDEQGKVLLYNLRPYEANHISIAPQELPLDTAIGATSSIVAPPYRSGVVARFPIERIKGATFRLVAADDTPLPAGATVTLKGSEFPVVLDGMVYVTGYDHGLGGEAAWPGHHCKFRLPPPPSDEALPDLGTVQCRASGRNAP